MTGRQSMTVILAVCLTVVLVSLATLQGQQNAQVAPARVAVVNLDRVFTNLAETRAVQADIESQREALMREQQERQQEIRDLDNDYSILDAGSAEAQRTREEIETRLVELEVWQQISSRKLERERAIRVGDIYRKMMDGIERIADREGYDVVLFKDETPDFTGAENQQQVAARIQSRKLLYSADQLDISDRLLQRMNNEYEAN